MKHIFKNTAYKVSIIQAAFVIIIFMVFLSANFLLIKNFLFLNMKREMQQVANLIEHKLTDSYNPDSSFLIFPLNELSLDFTDEISFNVHLISVDFSTYISNRSYTIGYFDNEQQIKYLQKFESPENPKKSIFIGNFTSNLSKKATYAYITYISEIDCFLAISHKRNILFSYLGHYSAILILIFAFILMVSGFSLFKINLKYYSPFSEIIKSLQKSKYVKLRFDIKTDEAMLIKRSLDLLQNQLDFYTQKLDLNSKESSQIERDLKIAKKLQSSILPKRLNNNDIDNKISLSAYSEAAFEVGGDLYDYFIIDKNRLLFAVGDVSGKGIPAALFMIFTQTLLRSIAKPGMLISDIVETLNTKLADENVSDLFVTAVIGIIDFRTGKITYCNAAHNYPLIIRNEGIIEEASDSHGIPLGIYSGRKYSFSEIQLNINDQFFIYTDGIVDTKDENGMNYSVEVLKYNLMGSWFMTSAEVQEKIRQSVTDFKGSVAPVDDLTLLILQYTNGDK